MKDQILPHDLQVLATACQRADISFQETYSKLQNTLKLVKDLQSISSLNYSDLNLAMWFPFSPHPEVLDLMSLKISLRLEKLMKEARVTLANMSKHSSNSYEKFQEFCKKIGKRKEVIIMETENELDSLIKVQLDTLNISMSNLNNIKYFN